MVESINNITPQIIIPERETPQQVTTPNFKADGYSDYERVPTEDSFEKSGNNTKRNAAIGLSVLGLLIGGYFAGKHGYLGKWIETKLGGAKKAAENAVNNTKENISVTKSFKDIYNDAIKTKKTTLEDPLRKRTHNFEYDADGNLIREIVKKDDSYAIYEKVNGKMKIVEIKKGERITKRVFNEKGNVEKPEKLSIKNPETEIPKPKTNKEDNINAGLNSPNSTLRKKAQRQLDKKTPLCKRGKTSRKKH